MSQYKSQIQNQFLSAARKKHLKVEVILETGTVLRGKIRAYDQFSISLSFRDKVEIIYKSSIIYIAIMPSRMRKSYDRRPGGNRRSGSNYRRRGPDYFDEPDDPPPPKKPSKMII
jgi:RNA chaperone Hfq